MNMLSVLYSIQSDLHTITTVAASKSFSSDRLWLNGTEVELNGRALAVLREIRSLARDRTSGEGNEGGESSSSEVVMRKEDWLQYRLHISSVNTFPTGAGLASSAAGLACLVAALAKLYCVEERFPGQLTAIARQGSGSASRSMFGGFVRWQKGEKKDGSDSIAVQIADEKVDVSFCISGLYLCLNSFLLSIVLAGDSGCYSCG